MLPRKILAWLIGASQLVLGLAFLVVPDLFLAAFGFTPASADQKYLYGQLAARFLAFGLGMFYLAQNLSRNRFWWDMMLLIQVIDFAVGLYYSALVGVPWSISAFPMFNAAVFSLLLLWGRLAPLEDCPTTSSR